MFPAWAHVQESSVVQHDQHEYHVNQEETSETLVLPTQLFMSGPHLKPLVRAIFRTLSKL